MRLEFTLIRSADRTIEFRPSSVPVLPNGWVPQPPDVLKQWWQYIDASEQRIDYTPREVIGDPDNDNFRLSFLFDAQERPWSLADVLAETDGGFAVVNTRARLRFTVTNNLLPRGVGHFCIQVLPQSHTEKVGRTARHPLPSPNTASIPIPTPTEAMLMWWMQGNPQAKLLDQKFVELLTYRKVQLDLIGKMQPKE